MITIIWYKITCILVPINKDVLSIISIFYIYLHIIQNLYLFKIAINLFVVNIG